MQNANRKKQRWKNKRQGEKRKSKGKEAKDGSPVNSIEKILHKCFPLKDFLISLLNFH